MQQAPLDRRLCWARSHATAPKKDPCKQVFNAVWRLSLNGTMSSPSVTCENVAQPNNPERRQPSFQLTWHRRQAMLREVYALRAPVGRRDSAALVMTFGSRRLRSSLWSMAAFSSPSLDGVPRPAGFRFGAGSERLVPACRGSRNPPGTRLLRAASGPAGGNLTGQPHCTAR
jgi:hypothetical protein